MTATAPPASGASSGPGGFDSSQLHSLTRPNLVSVGTIVWLSSELMFFAGLFSMYFTLRAVHAGDWPQTIIHNGVAEKLTPDVPYATVFTIILVLSSVPCQWGVFAAERGDVYKLRRWFAVTFVMGLTFIVGTLIEYKMEVDKGNTLHASGYGSVFYLLTGFHSLHVIGGLVAFILFLARTTLGRFTPAQATAAIVVSYYWHFVDIVWIGLFATIYLLQ